MKYFILPILSFTLSYIYFNFPTTPIKRTYREFYNDIKLSKDIRQTAEIALAQQGCLAITVKKTGYNIYTDSACASLFLRPNAILKNDEDKNDVIRFAYAYPDSGGIAIVFHEMQYDEYLHYALKVLLKSDSFKIQKIIYVNNVDDTRFQTDTQFLYLNTDKYAIGDTIWGYLKYTGTQYNKESGKVVRPGHKEGYFKCVIGASKSPFDYVHTYERCIPIGGNRLTREFQTFERVPNKPTGKPRRHR